MTGNDNMFTSLEDPGDHEHVTYGDNSRGKVLDLGRIAISKDLEKIPWKALKQITLPSMALKNKTPFCGLLFIFVLLHGPPIRPVRPIR